MSINLKNDETVRLIRELARVTGEKQTEAVTIAVKERLEKVKAPLRKRDVKRIEAIIADASKRFRPPYDTIDHGDLLYDEKTGLPK